MESAAPQTPVQALEARHHHHAVALQLGGDTLGLQAADAGLGVGTVGAEARLPAGQADGMAAQLVQGHGQQRNADLLTMNEPEYITSKYKVK